MKGNGWTAITAPEFCFQNQDMPQKCDKVGIETRTTLLETLYPIYN
jgi:hypothetical protein